MVAAALAFRGKPDCDNVVAFVVAFESFLGGYTTDPSNRVKIILDYNTYSDKLWDLVLDRLTTNSYYARSFYDYNL